VEAALVVARHYVVADAALHLEPGDEGGDEVAAGEALPLGERQGGGEDGDRRVAAHADVDVVVVEGVRGGTVDQRRLER
jgi:hypothetical protein